MFIQLVDPQAPCDLRAVRQPALSDGWPHLLRLPRASVPGVLRDCFRIC
jgi:hypothetical protein